ncbi:Spherulation-specific family 4-domain-containing protein [Mycena epipterygia]|nr:Spherulation-specific family 4-domain-containing protein [Mycena epipterygia]
MRLRWSRTSFRHNFFFPSMLPYGISILLTQLVLASCIHALGVLLPLYIYPGTNCAAWSPVSDAIAAHSSTQWYIIINPDSGPGSPDSTYQGCVAALPTSKNQIRMGYVDTTTGNVIADIDTYAGWDSSSRPTGIFFDNVSDANPISTYQSYVTHAMSKGFTFTALDPGEAAQSAYFSMVNLVNTYEDSYSSFSSSLLSGNLSKQSVILVNAPSTGSYSTVISQLESLGVAAVYISNVADSSQGLPVQLSEFVSEVASTGGSSTTSGSTSSRSTSGSISGTTSSSSTSSVTSTQSSVSSPSSGVSNEPVSAAKKGPPIAAIVGGVLGGLVFLLVLLVVFMCLRRRHPTVSPEAVAAPFVETMEYHSNRTESTSPVSSPNNDSDVKMRLPLAGPSTDVDVAESSAASTLEASAEASYHSTARLSAAPTYGRDRDSTGPPPSYSVA